MSCRGVCAFEWFHPCVRAPLDLTQLLEDEDALIEMHLSERFHYEASSSVQRSQQTFSEWFGGANTEELVNLLQVGVSHS